jgi:hypothetical protein
MSFLSNNKMSIEKIINNEYTNSNTIDTYRNSCDYIDNSCDYIDNTYDEYSDNYSNSSFSLNKSKIKLKEGWSLLRYDNNKNIIETYLSSSSYNPYYSVLSRQSIKNSSGSASNIFNQYVKNINEYRNIRKELYNEDFSYLDKYTTDEYEIYNNDNDNYSSDLDSNDETDYYYKYEKKFDV